MGLKANEVIPESITPVPSSGETETETLSSSFAL